MKFTLSLSVHTHICTHTGTHRHTHACSHTNTLAHTSCVSQLREKAVTHSKDWSDVQIKEEERDEKKKNRWVPSNQLARELHQIGLSQSSSYFGVFFSLFSNLCLPPPPPTPTPNLHPPISLWFSDGISLLMPSMEGEASKLALFLLANAQEKRPLMKKEY